MKRKLHEKIEDIKVVNNIDNQDIDPVTKSVAPISFVDSVMQTRKKNSTVGKMFTKKSTEAKDALKKEISNDEHVEPLDEINVKEDNMLILDENLFEDMRSDNLEEGYRDFVFTVKCNNGPKELIRVVAEDKSKAEEYAKKMYAQNHTTYADDRHNVWSIEEFVGKGINESYGNNESVIRYPNGMEVTDVDLDRALDYQYGTDRDMDNSKYTDEEKQRAVTYWINKTDPNPYHTTYADDRHNKWSIEDGNCLDEAMDSSKFDKLLDKAFEFGYNYGYSDTFEDFMKKVKPNVKQSLTKDMLIRLKDAFDNGNHEGDVDDIDESLKEPDDSQFDKAVKAMKAYWNYQMSLEQLHNTLLKIYNNDAEKAFKVFAEYGDAARRTKDECLNCDPNSQVKNESLKESVYRVTYTVAPNIYSSVMIKAKDEEDAKQRFAKHKVGKEIAGVKEMADYEVEDMLKRGMSLISEDLTEAYGDGWPDEIIDDRLFRNLDQFLYEIRMARRGAYTACKTFKELAEYVRVLSSRMDEYADSLEDIDDEGLDEGLKEATVKRDFYQYKPWSSAVPVYDKIEEVGKLSSLENLIDEMYPEGIDETDLNDLLSFDTDWLADMLGIPELKDDEE